MMGLVSRLLEPDMVPITVEVLLFYVAAFVFLVRERRRER